MLLRTSYELNIFVLLMKTLKIYPFHVRNGKLHANYCQISNISHTFVGN